jgi:hypothetical protein
MLVKKSLDGLTKPEAETLAGVRLSTTMHLVALAAGADPELRAMALGRFFALVLSAPGLPRAGISTRGGRIAAWSGGEPKPAGAGGTSLILCFASARAAARVLGGGGGTPLPLPLGPGALAALGFFRAAAARVPLMLKDPGLESALKARMLAEAALRGLAEVAARDPGLEERMHHIPDGSVAVEALGAFSIGLKKTGRRIEVLGTTPTSPNARLTFRDASSAVAVFSGARPAVVALGAGEVAIKGLLPLIQGLFAVLDRLGDYLAVNSKGGSR